MTTAIPALVDSGALFAPRSGELDGAQIDALISKMWLLHTADRVWLDRVYEYVRGERGLPNVPEGASAEVRELARLSVKNVLALVRDSFAQNLSVVGYRHATAKENAPGWELWQRNRMDARQAEVHKPALTYGSAYVSVLPGEDGEPVFRTRSPRQMLAVYEDPSLDAWPQFALESWVTERNATRRRVGLLFDDTYMYELDLGAVTDGEVARASQPIRVVDVTDVRPHGAMYDGKPVCPVVRFVNTRDADDMIVGEIAPLILMQQAINSVNFDRMIVCRFGAQPQRVITGWQGSKQEVLKASAMRVWTFDDPDVKASAFPAASVEPYNTVLEEMLQHVAMVAQISPSQVTGKMINVSAEALAAAEAQQTRKLAAKRESFGESWEQVLRLGLQMKGAAADDDSDSGAEVVWRDTEARSFGAVVDGVTKLGQAGVPIKHLLAMIPGLTQQQIQAIADDLRGTEAGSLVDKLLAQPRQELAAPPVEKVLTEDAADSGS